MTTTLIVLAMYIVIHVLSYLGKEAAKRKEKERQREAAQRRQVEAGRMPPPAPTGPRTLSIEPGFGSAGGPMGTTAIPQPPRRTGKPVDDVVARRREQLDQLRQRREGKRAGSTPPSPPVPVPTAPRMPGPRSGEIARDEMRARQELERRRRSEVEGNRLKQQRAAQQQREAEAAKGRREAALGQVLQASLRPDLPRTRPQTALVTDSLVSGVPLRLAVAERLHNPASLRQFFVMRELLDRPLSLRDTEY